MVLLLIKDMAQGWLNVDIISPKILLPSVPEISLA